MSGPLPEKWLLEAVVLSLPQAQQRLARAQRPARGHGCQAAICMGLGGGLLGGNRLAMPSAALYDRYFSDFHWWAMDNDVSFSIPDEVDSALVGQFRDRLLLGHNRGAGDRALARVDVSTLDLKVPGGTMPPSAETALVP